jgi:hypothetical protein
VIDSYITIYFSRDERPENKVKNLLYLMNKATLTDITCIEELLHKLIVGEVFERQVFDLLWENYFSPTTQKQD